MKVVDANKVHGLRYNRLAFDKWEEPAKPPLELMPKIHNELRLNDIVAA